MSEDNGATLEQRLDYLESRSEIAALAADYCHGLDRHDIQRFLAIWTPDGFWAIGDPHGDFRGEDELRRAAGVVWAALPETHHWTTNHVIAFEDADRATGLSSVHTEAIDSDGRHLTIAAAYVDEYVRRQGNWRIASRMCENYYFKPLAAG